MSSIEPMDRFSTTQSINVTPVLWVCKPFNRLSYHKPLKCFSEGFFNEKSVQQQQFLASKDTVFCSAVSRTAIWIWSLKQGGEKLAGSELSSARLSWSWAEVFLRQLWEFCSSKWREWAVSRSRGAERQLKASNEPCSFTAELMETSGDLGRLHTACVCVCVISPRGKHTLQHPNGYLWDLIPGTSAALQVCCHHFLLLLHFFSSAAFFLPSESSEPNRFFNQQQQQQTINKTILECLFL